ncbi:GFA family protein, partial [Rhodobacteraceae bacterium RKSG542]|uniref:GFA family protein n=1 Tax=Pseudovibrio flavus TaxID=2529854 RepID=UPI0012BCEF3B
DSLVVDLDQLAIKAGGDALSWYQSSALVHRGFCNKCGSSLFWKYQDANAATPTIDVSAGTLEDTGGLTLTRHIFCASKGDYYEIDDQVQQFETS